MVELFYYNLPTFTASFFPELAKLMMENNHMVCSKGIHKVSWALMIETSLEYPWKVGNDKFLFD